jgi:hypothetical protein
MVLDAKLAAKKCGKSYCVVDGDTWEIRDLERAECGKLQAKCRSKATGVSDMHRLEAELLVRCVYNPETSEPCSTHHSDWEKVPRRISGPLIAAVMKANGYDEADLGKEKPEQDSTAETPTLN